MKKLFTLLFVLISVNAFALDRVLFPPDYYPDPTAGRPVSNGYIYVGDPDTDPEVVGNQKQVSALQEDTTTVNIPQPVRTNSGGVPTYNGSPVTLFVDGDYSLKVLNSSQSQVYYVPEQLSTSDTDELAKVSSNDTTAGYLGSKITSTGGTITITEVNDGGDETLNIEVPAATSTFWDQNSQTLASAATVNIGASNGTLKIITGTTTITAFDTVAAGTSRFLKFSGALTLTHNATSLILPTGANITTQDGDTALFVSEGSGNWRCHYYTAVGSGSVSTGGELKYDTVTSTETWASFKSSNSIPDTVTTVGVYLTSGGGGGGGGGGGAGTGQTGGGGGSGASGMVVHGFVTPSGSITIGAGGAAGTAGPVDTVGGTGGTGGTSSFVGLSIVGGNGGSGGSPGTGGGAGSGGAGGTLKAAGRYGVVGVAGNDGSDGGGSPGSGGSSTGNSAGGSGGAGGTGGLGNTPGSAGSVGTAGEATIWWVE